jgi:hypothetical protein
MEPEIFRYVRIGHHSPGCLYIGFELEREEGIQFPVMIPIEDAARLRDDLSSQIRFASDSSE